MLLAILLLLLLLMLVSVTVVLAFEVEEEFAVTSLQCVVSSEVLAVSLAATGNAGRGMFKCAKLPPGMTRCLYRSWLC